MTIRANRTLIQAIASTIHAYQNCLAGQNEPWEAVHADNLAQMAKLLPSGSGIDKGTTLDIERSSGEKVVLTAGFHHMDEHGSYDGWTEHVFTVTPTFDGIDIRISGSNRNGIKDYLHDVYHHVLTDTVIETYSETTGAMSYTLGMWQRT